MIAKPATVTRHTFGEHATRWNIPCHWRNPSSSCDSKLRQIPISRTCRAMGSAEGYHPFGAAKAITEPPPFRTPWHHMKTHAVYVRENVTALARSCGTHDPRGE